jgi:hypothetical protein
MKMKLTLAAMTLLVALFGVTWARPVVDEGVSAKIAWYSTLDSGLAEAARSNRPILLISAAPQCLGVSGTW